MCNIIILLPCSTIRTSGGSKEVDRAVYFSCVLTAWLFTLSLFVGVIVVFTLDVINSFQIS